MGLPSAIQRALKLSNVAYLCSAALIIIRAQFTTEQIILYIRSFSVFLCWELSHHLHQVLHAKRFSYSLPKGSAAAETNPCEPLLAALEESIPDSLPQYLAELHFLKKLARLTKKVVAACLRPLEQVTSNLSEVLEGCYVDKAYQLSNQFQLPTDTQLDSKYYESLNNFQMISPIFNIHLYQEVCMVCTAVASTERSHDEDSLGLRNSLVAMLLLFQPLYLALLLLKLSQGRRQACNPNS